MYLLAALAIASFRQAASMKRASPLDSVPADDRHEVEERAAILEFDGTLSRDQAERLALLTYLRSQSRH